MLRLTKGVYHLFSLIMNWIWALLLLARVADTEIQREVCQLESFQADCPNGQVIIMNQARYGRMMLGRCLKRNYYVGCSSDVIRHMDNKCSGRRECRVPIPDPELFEAQPCPKDLVAYLDATFNCRTVHSGDPLSCKTQGYLLVTATLGYLASALTWERGLGSPDCPWRIQASPGQRVRLHLYDFNLEPHMTTPGSLEDCRRYGYIKEHGGELSSTICGSDKREQHIYTSRTEVVDVLFLDKVTSPPYFVIKYEVFGCPLPAVQPDAWMEVRDDTIVVRCNNSEVLYHLFCDGKTWVGNVKNCSAASASEFQQESDSAMPFGLFIAISIGVALGVLLGIALLFLSYTFYNREKRQKAKHDENILLKEQTSSSTATYGRPPYADATLQQFHYIPKLEPCGHSHDTFVPMMQSKHCDYEVGGGKRESFLYGPLTCVHDSDPRSETTINHVLDAHHVHDVHFVDVVPPCGKLPTNDKYMDDREVVGRRVNKDIVYADREAMQKGHAS